MGLLARKYPALAAVLGSVSPEQRERFEQYRARVFPEQPAWAELEKKLLAVGGEAIVFVFEEDIDKLLKRGKSYKAAGLKRMAGPPSRCHSNTAALWEANADKGLKIVSGWALGDDGLWRQHTWGFWKGKVIETTVPSEAYFGYELTDPESKLFAAENY